jgi:hypothetical protein
VNNLTPVGDTSKKVSAEKNLEIWIDKTGSVSLDGDRSTLTVQYRMVSLVVKEGGQ